MVSSGDIAGGTGGVGLGLQAIGLAGSIYSGLQEADLQKQAAQDSQQVAVYEQQLNEQRQQQMVLFNQRQQTENYRNVQRARAMGMAASVSGGANMGSGIAGAQSGESAQGAQNSRNLNQDLQIGNNIFALTGQISQERMNMAGLESSAASWAGTGAIFGGLSGLGSGLTGSAGNIGHLMGSS